MQALADVILPVFLVIGFGYVARWRNLINDAQVDGVVWFTQTFAIPCLLFVAIARLDLGQEFNWRLLVSFYTGAIAGFTLGFWGARLIFKRDWEDCVVIGFIALFSNSVLLGLPITERAYGPDSLAEQYRGFARMRCPFDLVGGGQIRAVTHVARISSQSRIMPAIWSETLSSGLAPSIMRIRSGLAFASARNPVRRAV